MAEYKKTKVLKNLSKIARKAASSAGSSSRGGVAGGQNYDANPRLNSTLSEKEIGNAHNASIVFGKDRPGSRLSGFGGIGDTHCAAIDIVAGRMAHRARTTDEDDNQIYVDPNFTVDAARIYLSQKTNVDRNFRLAQGSQPYGDVRSAIAIKADGVRVIAREGVKIVTGVDRVNSQGSEISNRAYGIDLIANNDDSGLQPMVKGDNLVQLFLALFEHVDKLAGVVNSFLHTQMTFNASAMAHTHMTAFFGTPVSTSPGLMTVGTTTAIDQFARVEGGLLAHRINGSFMRLNYLTAGSKKYINSFYNHVN